MIKILKLTKEKLNELLYYLSTDNFKNTLILKIAYIYGKNMREVLILKSEDINIDDETITFNIYKDKVTYPLKKELLDELLGYIYDQELNPQDYIFKESGERVHMSIKKLNNYLHSTILSLNKILDLQLPELTTKDFKIMRGQHLYLDGVDIRLVHEFISGNNIKVTKNILNFKELQQLKFPCIDTDDIFDNYTDLEIFYDEQFDDSELYTVSSVEDSIIIEIMQDTGEIHIIDNDNELLTDKIKEYPTEYLVNELKTLTVTGQYKIIDDLRFLKN